VLKQVLVDSGVSSIGELLSQSSLSLFRAG
jgi:hypothetical protein